MPRLQGHTVTPTERWTPHRTYYRDLLRNVPAGTGYDIPTALRLIHSGLRPVDVYALAYPDRRSALLHARANREAYGHEIAGIVNVESVGWVVVLDLRRAFAEMSAR